jgi:hypothetical protein
MFDFAWREVMLPSLGLRLKSNGRDGRLGRTEEMSRTAEIDNLRSSVPVRKLADSRAFGWTSQIEKQAAQCNVWIRLRYIHPIPSFAVYSLGQTSICSFTKSSAANSLVDPLHHRQTQAFVRAALHQNGIDAH